MFEEAVIYAVMIAVGSLIVATTLIGGDRFEGGTTLCLLMTTLGAAGLVRLAARRARVPRARAVRRRRTRRGT